MNTLASNFKCGRFNVIPTPNWIRQYDNCTPIISYNVSFTYFDYTINTPHTPQIIFTIYKDNINQGTFAGLNIIGKNKDKPFPKIDNILKTIQVDNISISQDCRLTVCGKSIYPIDGLFELVNNVMYKYNKWYLFPTIESWQLVTQLENSLTAIKKFQQEESDHELQNKVEALRCKLKNIQNDIVEHESEINKIYEDAADAFNLMEKHGIDLNTIEEL